jgi:tocopherol O-methyltransferase
MPFETEVSKYYEDALECYEWFLGGSWHQGDPDAAANGASDAEAMVIIEETIARETKVGPEGWVLDFGSGIGGPTLQMAKITGASYVGITNNDRLTTRARARADAAGLAHRVRFATVGDTDYAHLPFPSRSFDAVTFFDSVCHLTDKAAFFKEVARILKPGGRIAGIDWLQRAFGEHQTEEQIMRFMRPLNEHVFIPWHGTVDGYAKMMRDAGLEVTMARDLWEGKICTGSLTEPQRRDWQDYKGPQPALFEGGQAALDAARRAGVFTGGMFVAVKPG